MNIFNIADAVTLRADKGSELTHEEMDTNLRALALSTIIGGEAIGAVKNAYKITQAVMSDINSGGVSFDTVKGYIAFDISEIMPESLDYAEFVFNSQLYSFSNANLLLLDWSVLDLYNGAIRYSDNGSNGSSIQMSVKGDILVFATAEDSVTMTHVSIHEAGGPGVEG